MATNSPPKARTKHGAPKALALLYRVARTLGPSTLLIARVSRTLDRNFGYKHLRAAHDTIEHTKRTPPTPITVVLTKDHKSHAQHR